MRYTLLACWSLLRLLLDEIFVAPHALRWEHALWFIVVAHARHAVISTVPAWQARQFDASTRIAHLPERRSDAAWMPGLGLNVAGAANLCRQMVKVIKPV